MYVQAGMEIEDMRILVDLLLLFFPVFFILGSLIPTAILDTLHQITLAACPTSWHLLGRHAGCTENGTPKMLTCFAPPNIIKKICMSAQNFWMMNFNIDSGFLFNFSILEEI